MVTLSALDGMTQVSETEWNMCAGSDNPFVSHAFLLALEQSGSACLETGWMPHHLIARDDHGVLIGAVPLYVKNHSYGEYVFDWAWANWLHQHGKPYYPKFQCAVPFSPVTGPRLLVRAGQDRAGVLDLLIQGLLTLAQQSKLSSLHITFPTEEEAQILGISGFLLRKGCQFHWHNQGYGSFDDFLAELSSRKRKQIKKERASVSASGVVIQTLVGEDIKAHHWDDFYGFYLSTIDRKAGEAYLTRAFFEALSGPSLRDQVVLMLAQQDGQSIAGAYNLLGSHTLYGRNWGAVVDIPFLHFETCYYRALDLAIDLKLNTVEAGAQGAHKLDRGYLPTTTWSAHWLADPGFSKAVSHFLDHERVMVDKEMTALGEHSPFKKGES